MGFAEELQEKTRQTEAIVESYLPTDAEYQKEVVEAMRYAVLGGGKRLRPLLMGETYKLFGGKSKVIEPFQAAIEMIHTYSLVHDDLPCMDNDDYRRGRKTVHVVYGEAMGVLTGDALLNYAFETATKAFEMEPENGNVGKALRYFSKKAGIYGMVGGQVVDVQNEGKPLDEKQLQFIYQLKTGALLEAAMVTGAILAGATVNEQKMIEAVASEVGMAFQIKDDMLDVTSTMDKLGQPIGSDAKNQKTTYVTLKGLEESETQVEELTNRAISRLDSLVVKNGFLRELLLHLVKRKK